MSYSDNELIANGYPPRPGQPGDSAYASWLQVVSSDATVVGGELIADFSKSAGSSTTTATRWGAIILNQPGVEYVLATGTIAVPYFYDPQYFVTQSLFWSGIGGFNGDNAMIQNGFELDDDGAFGYSYRPWMEYWIPNVTNQLYIGGFGLAAGQSLFVSCWASDQNGFRNANGAWGAYYFHDLTTGFTAGTYLIQNPGVAFRGTSEEATVERRPGQPLTNFSSTTNVNVGYDIHNIPHTTNTDFFWQEILVGGSGDYMTYPLQSPDGETDHFYWEQYN